MGAMSERPFGVCETRRSPGRNWPCRPRPAELSGVALTPECRPRAHLRNVRRGLWCHPACRRDKSGEVADPHRP